MMVQNENTQRLAQAWKQAPKVNQIAVVLLRTDGTVLISKTGKEWGLPMAFGHGVRPNYGEPLAKIAQHFHFSLVLETLQPVGVFPDGKDVLNVVSLQVPGTNYFTPADGRWVTLAELAKLDGVNAIAKQALAALEALLESLVAATQVVIEAVVAAPVKQLAKKSSAKPADTKAVPAEVAKPKRQRPSRANTRVAKMEFVQ